MNDPNRTQQGQVSSSGDVMLRQLLAQALMKSRMINELEALESLVDETLRKIHRAYHAQDQLLTEKEVAQRRPFLTLAKLRSMRARGGKRNLRFLKFGNSRNSRVFYRIADIVDWISADYQR